MQDPNALLNTGANTGANTSSDRDYVLQQRGAAGVGPGAANGASNAGYDNVSVIQELFIGTC